MDMKKHTSMQKIAWGMVPLALVLLFAGAGCSLFSSSEVNETPTDAMMEGTKNDTMNDTIMEDTDQMRRDEGSMMEAQGEAMMEGDGEAMKKDEGENMMEGDDTMMQKDESAAAENTPGTYENYSEGKVAFASQGDVVLFFHAPWCPTCRALDTSINTSLSAIPQNTKILKVDYDSATELKKKYGVTYQHTLVQVDAQGNMITKWSGGNTLESVVSKIQ